MTHLASCTREQPHDGLCDPVHYHGPTTDMSQHQDCLLRAALDEVAVEERLHAVEALLRGKMAEGIHHQTGMNGEPLPPKRKPLWMRLRYRLEMAWYRWGPRVHVGRCDLHCGCDEYYR